MKRIIPIILVMAVLFSFFAIVTSADVAYNNISTSYSVDGTYSYRTPYTEEGIYRLGYNYVLLGPHSVEPSNGTYIYTEPFGVTIDGVYCDVVITYLQNGLVSIGFMSNGNTLYNLTYLEDGGISDTTLVGKTVTFDDVTIDRHSVLVIVQGGSDEDVANALFKKVSAGCGYTIISGQSRNVTVVDYVNNIPVQYQIRFNRPQNVEIKCSVSVGRNNYTGNDLENAVKTAILDWANNQNNEVDGLILGTDIYSYEIGSAISNQIPEIVIKDVQIAKINDTLSSSPITIKINELGVITANNITVEITD